jgi:hypothetical protein
MEVRPVGAGAFILLAVFAGFAFWLGQTQRANLEAELIDGVQARGGTVISVDRPWFKNGPWLFRGKGRTIIKVVYQDAEGNLRQVWGRTGMLSNDVDWDYDDGDYGG